MSLEISQRELQDCFRPHPNQRSEQEVMDAQSPKSPNRDSFGTVSGLHFGSPRKKSHLDAGAAEQRRE
jgi:hypothetical protein